MPGLKKIQTTLYMLIVKKKQYHSKDFINVRVLGFQSQTQNLELR